MIKITSLFTFLITSIIFPVFADSEYVAKKSYASRVIDGHKFTDHMLLNDSLILNFVSDPKAWNHFVSGQKETRELAFKWKDKVEELKRKYPERPEVDSFRSWFMNDFSRFESPLPFEDIVAPFVVLGVGDTSAIADVATLGNIRTIQVQIFKNWLARYRIGEENSNFLFEMREYAHRSSLDIFRHILRPIFDAIEDYDDIIDAYISDERFSYADEYESEFQLTSEAEEALAREIELSLAGIFSSEAEPFEFNEISDETTLAIGKEIETLSKEMGSSFDVISEKYYSRDAIILLFLEVNNLLDY